MHMHDELMHILTADLALDAAEEVAASSPRKQRVAQSAKRLKDAIDHLGISRLS